MNRKDDNILLSFQITCAYKFLSCFTFFNTTDHEYFVAGFMNFVSEAGALLERNKPALTAMKK